MATCSAAAEPLQPATTESSCDPQPDRSHPGQLIPLRSRYNTPVLRRPVNRAPVPSTDRGPAAIPYSKTAARQPASGHTYRPKLSCNSLTKCWKCSVISVTFAVGCKSPFRRFRFLLGSQNLLTPSCFYTQEFTSPHPFCRAARTIFALRAGAR